MTERDLELLSAYLDDALADDERAALELRLLNESDLRRELELLRETKALIAALPQLLAPRPLTLTSTQVGDSEPRHSLLLSPWISFASAAAAFLMVAAGVLSLSSSALMPRSALVAALPTAASALTDAAPPIALQSAATVEALDAVGMAVTTAGMAEPAASIAVTGSPEQAAGAVAPMMALSTRSITGTPAPLGTMPPPATADDAARSDGFVHVTFTPVPLDAVNMAMESAPAGGFATETESQLATPAADLIMGAAVPAPIPHDTQETQASGLTNEVTADAAPDESVMMMIEPSPTVLAYAATLQTMPVPIQTLPPSPDLTREGETDTVPTVPYFRDPIGVGLIVAGMLFLFVAMVTTLMRMRR